MIINLVLFAALVLALALIGTALEQDPLPGVEPKTVSSDLQYPGEVLPIEKTVTTPPIAPKPEICFLADSTSSMGGPIANVKTNAVAELYHRLMAVI